MVHGQQRNHHQTMSQNQYTTTMLMYVIAERCIGSPLIVTHVVIAIQK